MLSLLAQIDQPVFDRPEIDWHAVSPELLLLGLGALVTTLDIIFLERIRKYMPTLTGLTFLIPLIALLSLWADGDELPRTMFDGAYVVDRYSLAIKMLFLISGYVVVLLSTDYMAEGDYYDSEFYQLLSASVLGMVVMASARDLISIFVALELLSIPAYLMAAWRKRDLKSNEAGLKYMLMGVFASAIMLYGMSILYGVSGSTNLSVIAQSDILNGSTRPIVTLAIVFTIIGFGFKVSAVPFHSWAPDTYEGAPTPLTAFLAVASKAAGFVALMNIVLVALPAQSEVVEPLMWVLSAATMTIGNLIAIRQTNIVRLLAYSGIAQAGYMLAPLAVYGQEFNETNPANAIVNYLLVYSAMNLGAFAVVLLVARKTMSGEISSLGGLMRYAPGIGAAMTLFLFSLAGIPPVGGWWAKFQIFNVLTQNPSFFGISLAVIAAVNSVVAAYYYLNIAKQMWFLPEPNEDHTPISFPAPLATALAITVVATIVFGILPGITGDLSDFTNLASR